MALVALVTKVEPIAEAICEPVAAVNAEVPLPYAIPLKVVTPVPPAATGKVPAVKADADVEYSALLAPVNVVNPVPP